MENYVADDTEYCNSLQIYIIVWHKFTQRPYFNNTEYILGILNEVGVPHKKQQYAEGFLQVN